MSNTRKTILVVDDDATLRRLLETTLDTGEFSIIQASSGATAIELAHQLHPDLIILDVHLTPRHPNGFEVCRQLKEDPATATAHIIILTGSAQNEDRKNAQQAAADFYMVKPFSPRIMLDHIYAVLQPRQGPSAPNNPAPGESNN